VRAPWRSFPIATPFKLATTAAVIVVAVTGAALMLNRGPGPGVAGIPVPTGSPPSSAALPSATLRASASPSPAPSSLDTSSWKTYQSEQYDFAIGHPRNWVELPASRAWSAAADTNDWLSPGMDAFMGDNIRVSAWEVPLERGFPADPTWSDVETWIEGFCLDTNKAPCDRSYIDSAVKLCVERRDCHPSGLLVTGASEVQAFFTSGSDDRVMVIVSVWWGEGEPATAPYGGSRRLLEGFLATMNVWDAGDRGGPPPSTSP
jgi:hypothetical protein